MEKYDEFYYGYQVKGRGLKSTTELNAEFERRVRIYDSLLSKFLPAPGVALDLGAGYGNFLYYLRKRGWVDISGVDLDQGQVDLALSLGLDVIHGDAMAAIANATNVSLVSAFDLIEHLSKNAAVELIQSAFSALVDGGTFIVQCPCADGFTGAHDWGNDLTHQWSPSSNALSQMLRAAGFRRVETVDLSLPPFPRGWQEISKNSIRRSARAGLRPLMSILGIKPPRVWSNSQIAVAFK